jgi:hypothetical protein
MRKVVVLIVLLLFTCAVAAPSFAAVKKPAKKKVTAKKAKKKKAAVKKKVVKKKIVRKTVVTARPKFPVAAARVVEAPAPAPHPIIMPPVPEPKPAGKAGWFVEGGPAGGALAVEGGYRKQFSDKLYVSGAAGYAIGSGFGIVVLDLARVQYDLGTYYVGGGLSYAMYSKAVKNVPGLGNVTNQNLAGVEVTGGMRINERLSARVGYSTCLGLRGAVSYDL